VVVLGGILVGEGAGHLGTQRDLEASSTDLRGRNKNI
jgi:hypothetical protein